MLLLKTIYFIRINDMSNLMKKHCSHFIFI